MRCSWATAKEFRSSRALGIDAKKNRRGAIGLRVRERAHQTPRSESHPRIMRGASAMALLLPTGTVESIGGDASLGEGRSVTGPFARTER